MPVTGAIAKRPPPPAARLVPLMSGLALVAAVTISGWAISEAESTRKARITSSTDQSAAWTVSEGVLQITIQQLGAPITGTFESWTADIAFSTPSNARPNGQVKVTIDISSLELGIVSAQAMGPDFFDAERFPTAVFDARIRASDENYVANGTLTLKGITHPVRMPFLMTIEDGVATMTARHVLNRTDFDIGRSFSDQSQLGFDVTVDIELSARRAP